MAVSASDSNTIQLRLRNAIYLYPIQKSLLELTNIMSECSIKDLQIFFPFLVEHIFGINPSYGSGWNLLRTSKKYNNSEFEALLRFLHPYGFFFELMYKLLSDVYLKYEYPLQFLPAKLRQIIVEGSAPQFYADKLQIDPGLREPTALVLNAFEFYFFHFVYHLINSWQSRMESGFSGDHETVYLHLSDQYLHYFLPIESSVVLPIVPAHQTMQLPRSPPPPKNQPQKSPKLFKNSVVKLGPTSLSPTTVTPHAEIWRSETFVQVIMNFWLSVPEHLMNSNPFVRIKIQQYHRYLSGYGPASYYPIMNSHCSPDIRATEDFLPKEDHLRVVRNMIKHIHYFVNNIRNDGSAMDELRKAILSLCRRPIYIFLRRHIYHWPLDSSFLLILETYLSFIQPWRYIKYNTRVSNECNIIDSKWFNFIVENFPTYTILIREIIPRFSRMDMTSPKHAHMLFRLSKVLSQANLSKILKDIEERLDEFNNAAQETPQAGNPKFSFGLGVSNTPPSMSLPFSNRLNVIIRQEIQELESLNFRYKPLFDQAFRQQVFEFVQTLQKSQSLVKCFLNSALAEGQMRQTNIFKKLKEYLFHSSTADDYTVDERQKTVSYIEHSIDFLSQVFELPPLQQPTEDKKDVQGSSLNSSCSQHFGPIEPTVINPKDWRTKAKLIKYEANPDLEPIRSTEVTFLVRFLHHVSSRINEKYKTKLKDFWERDDIWGGVARQLLAPPCKYYYFDKSVPGNFAPRVPNQLPPRVCLRSLASHQTLSYIIISGFLAYFYGYPMIPFYFFVFSLFVCFIFAKAVLEKYVNKRMTGLSEQQEPDRFVPLDVSFTD